MNYVKFEDLIGKTITEIDFSVSDRINFFTSDGKEYLMHHSQACCENVNVEDICGDLDDLLDTPVLDAYEKTNSDEHPKDSTINVSSQGESFTWTFYTITTAKGTVTIRWYGESNGYYSESVDFKLVK